MIGRKKPHEDAGDFAIGDKFRVNQGADPWINQFISDRSVFTVTAIDADIMFPIIGQDVHGNKVAVSAVEIEKVGA